MLEIMKKNARTSGTAGASHIWIPALIIGILPIIGGTGCSLLLGNVRPVEEKSDSYRIMDMTKINPDESTWTKLESASNTAEASVQSKQDNATSALSDVAYQSQKTASIISLDSACRPSYGTEKQNLHEFSRLLFLGITNIKLQTEKERAIQGLPALETTVHGTMNGETAMLKAIVLRKGSCIYDLMYIARPESFEKEMPDFENFVSSLRFQ